MKRIEVEKYLNKDVKLILNNDSNIYSGILKKSIYNLPNSKQTKYIIKNRKNEVTYEFKLSHIKSIKEI